MTNEELKPTILSFEDIQEKLQDLRLYKVAKITGLSYPTLRKFYNGTNLNCSMSSLQAISDYLNKR